MSEYDKMEYCPTCEEVTNVTTSGSGTKGFCHSCGKDFSLRRIGEMEEIKSNLEVKRPGLDAGNIFELGMAGIIPKNNAIESLFKKYHEAQTIGEKDRIINSVEWLMRPENGKKI
jgi:hypothetical protein